jgi:hypothetical protein
LEIWLCGQSSFLPFQPKGTNSCKFHLFALIQLELIKFVKATVFKFESTLLLILFDTGVEKCSSHQQISSTSKVTYSRISSFTIADQEEVLARVRKWTVSGTFEI